MACILWQMMAVPFNHFIAVLDTNVLAPMPVVDALLRLAEEPTFYLPKWSEDILRELESTLAKFGYSEAQVHRRISTMRTQFPEALVTGYEGLAEASTVDPKDRHVLACAIPVGAHAIVSNNCRHFPPPALNTLGIECVTPGEFLRQQYQLNPDRFIDILTQQSESISCTLERLLQNLPGDLKELIRP